MGEQISSLEFWGFTRHRKGDVAQPGFRIPFAVRSWRIGFDLRKQSARVFGKLLIEAAEKMRLTADLRVISHPLHEKLKGDEVRLAWRSAANEFPLAE